MGGDPSGDRVGLGDQGRILDGDKDAERLELPDEEAKELTFDERLDERFDEKEPKFGRSFTKTFGFCLSPSIK